MSSALPRPPMSVRRSTPSSIRSSGRARSGWDGGTRDTALDGHVAHGGHHARAHRNLLLPALNAAASRVGWVSRGALNHISKRLSVPPADAYGVASFYALTPTTPRAPIAAHVCDDIACRLAGAERICEELETTVGHAGAPLGDGDTTWLRSPCLGQCERAPAVLVTVAGPESGALVVGEIENAEAVVDTLGWVAEVAHEGPARVHAELRDVPAEPLEWVRGLAPQAGDDGLVLLARVGRVDPASLDAYRASGGYEALAKAVAVAPCRRDRGRDRRPPGRPRRGRLPDRPQVGRGRGAACDPPLRRVQRRRVRARHVQGPAHPRGGPVRARRGDDDRGIRGRRLARATSTFVASTRSPASAWSTRSR